MSMPASSRRETRVPSSCRIRSGIRSASAGKSAATSSGMPSAGTSRYDVAPSGTVSWSSSSTARPPSGADQRVHSSPLPSDGGTSTRPARTQWAACCPAPGSGGFATPIVRRWVARS